MLKYKHEKNEKRTRQGRAPSKITQNRTQTAKINRMNRIHKKINAASHTYAREQSEKGLSETGTSYPGSGYG